MGENAETSNIANENKANEDVVISVNNISKKFRVFYDRGASLKDMSISSKRRKHEIHTVLDGISFQVRRGEAIGLVGKNGCGKSTTLKMLSRIMYPDSGSIDVKGRVSALIELGAGFHPDMSGRENIYTNASIFGLKKQDVDSCIDEIIEFSELGDAIDNPVRTYSSGMYMRLAFSVAISVKANVLLIDEILAVGDAAFQAKCFNKLKEIKGQGTTIVIVSHALGQIEQICDRSIWIKDGKIEAEGNPFDVHPQYMQFMAQRKNIRKDNNSETVDFNSDFRWGSGDAEIQEVKILDENDEESYVLESGRPFKIVFKYKVNKKLDNPVCGIGIFRNDGTNVYGTNTLLDRVKNIDINNSSVVIFSIASNTLLEGEYSLDVSMHADDGFPYDFYRYAKKFTVTSAIKDIGVCRLEHEWEIK